MKKSKKIGIVLYFSFTGISLLAAYGIDNSFFPSATYIQYTQNLSLAFSCALTIFAYIILFKKDSRSIQALTKYKKGVIALILPFVTFCMPHTAITLGIPSVLHKFVTSTQGQELIVVKSINHLVYYSWRCSGRIDIEYNFLIKSRVCGVPKIIWEKTSKGDTLKFIGTKSVFGLNYDRVTLINSN